VLRETIPMRTGVSLPGLSAENAAEFRMDETKRKRRLPIHLVSLIGFSMNAQRADGCLALLRREEMGTKRIIRQHV
jgi:hypothetical protein